MFSAHIGHCFQDRVLGIWQGGSGMALTGQKPYTPGKMNSFRFSAKPNTLWTIHKGRPQNVRDFGPPPPLVRIFARSIRVNPRNLPYYVCFWATPLPPSRCGRPLCMAPYYNYYGPRGRRADFSLSLSLFPAAMFEVMISSGAIQ